MSQYQQVPALFRAGRWLRSVLGLYTAASSPTEQLTLGDTVQPVIDIFDPPFVEVGTQSVATEVTSAGAAVFPLEVPASEFWRVYQIEVVQESGTFTVDRIVTQYAANISFSEQTSGVARITWAEGGWLPMPPGTKIGAFVDTYSGTGNLRARCVRAIFNAPK